MILYKGAYIRSNDKSAAGGLFSGLCITTFAPKTDVRGIEKTNFTSFCTKVETIFSTYDKNAKFCT